MGRPSRSWQTTVRHKRTSHSGAIAVLLGLVAGSPGAGSALLHAQNCPATPGQQVVEGINTERRARKLAPLTVDARLVRAAQRHARDMARHRFLEHTGSDGSSMTDRIEQAGYRWLSASENVAAGQETAARVVAAWLDSPNHRRNMLDSEVRQVGIGYAQADDQYGHYWAASFGVVMGKPEPPPGGCHP